MLVACGSGEPAATSGGAGGAIEATATTDAAVTAGATQSSAAAGGAGGAAQDPDFESIPWVTGADVGFGVASKDTSNHLGQNVFIGYAGYGLTLDAAEKWVSALYASSLASRGVRYVFAVQGPADVAYSGLEIGNSKIAAALDGEVTGDTHFVLIAAHSSGSYVAHELLGQLASGSDPNGVTQDKVVYFDLDGGLLGLSAASVNRTRRTYFVSSFDATTSTYATNQSSMTAGASTYGQKGGYLELDASGAGCDAGANWCLHMTLITTLPHDPQNLDAIENYSDFVGRPVTHAYIDMKSADAALGP